MRTAEEHPPAETTRRNFFVAAIYAIWALIGAALGLPALIYLFFPPKARKQSEWVEIGDTRQLAADTPMAMIFRRNRTDGWKVISEESSAWLVKRPSGQIVAFGPQCTHLGCAYHWEEGKNEFVCPCHDSVFSLDGKVVSGPAPRPLDQYAVKIEGTKILLDSLHQVKEPKA